MDGVTYVEIQFYHLKFHNSINLWKNGQKHHKGFYSEGFSYIKLIKICKKKPVKKRVVYSWVWCHFQKNLCSFITSWKLAKTLQIFVWGPFSLKLTKIYHKKEMKFWPQVSFKKTFCFKQKLLWLEKTFHVKQYFITVSLVQCALESSTDPNRLYMQICNTCIMRECSVLSH